MAAARGPIAELIPNDPAHECSRKFASLSYQPASIKYANK